MKLRFIMLVLIFATMIAACAPRSEESQAIEIANTTVSAPTTTAKPASGNGMVATDPTTFSLTSGRLQLVEFFSFT